jgi:hypothetical protein
MAALCLDTIVKGNHSHVILLDILIHVDSVTYASKLPWHKYLQGQ